MLIIPAAQIQNPNAEIPNAEIPNPKLQLIFFAEIPNSKSQILVICAFWCPKSQIIWDSDNTYNVDQWLKYYHQVFFRITAKSILAELINYKRGKNPYNNDSFSQFRENILNFWKSTIEVELEFTKIIMYIHSICINSASYKKILAISQIHSNILYKHKINEVNQVNQEIKQLHIITPIIPNEDIDDLLIIDENINNLQIINKKILYNSINTTDSIIVSDDENINNDNNIEMQKENVVESNTEEDIKQ
ncbi:hypothetical protein Glove_575g52 [Diversispora epigaea]|uniref:Uncharacterized protein n=1 Tax=Diversispora epigaea TaxID=1348612 RepID=A0A397G9B5_9GLOM|nr:hypothetical protein Glove_575g52 [Diversispora epigaea]